MAKIEKLVSGIALAALGALAASPAMAQSGAPTAEEDRLGEIIVTARKTAENIQEIPVSVSAFDADSIEKLNIQGLSDVARFTPGFSFEQYSGGFPAPTIRGQTQTRIDLLVQNTASFFNGVYLQRGYMVDSSLLEVERIEVIKGPQSALYGRNAFSGAINYITKRPGDELEGAASVTVGSDSRMDIKGSVSFPITDNFGVIVAAGHTEFDGTWENNHPLAAQGGANGTDGKLGGWNKDSVLVGFVAEPIQGLEIDVAYTYSDIHVEHQPSYALSTTGAGALVNSLNCSPLAGIPAGPVQNRLFCGEIPVNPVLQPGETRPAGLVIDPRSFALSGPSSVFSAKVSYDLSNNWQVTYQHGRTDTEVQARGSPARNVTQGTTSVGTITGLTLFDSQPIGGFESESHEARIEYQGEGIVKRALAGIYKSDSVDDAAGRAEYARPNTLELPVGYFSLANQSRKDDVWGAFGLLSLQLTDALTVTGEVRQTQEELTLLVRQTATPTLTLLPLPPGPTNPPFYSAVPSQLGAPILRRQRDEFDYVTPRISVDLKLTEDNLLYGSVAKGVKSGGQNIPGLDPSQDTYEPEENWTYEIGLKNDFLDGRLRANIAAFYIDWTGIQGSVARNYPASGRVLGVNCFTACAVPAAGTPAAVIVGNLGDATVYGFETDGAWLASDNVTLNYALSYVEPTYNDGQISRRAAAARNCDGLVCATTVLDAQGRPTDGARIGGNDLERTPKLKFSLGGQLDWRSEGIDVDWSLRSDVTYQSKQFVDELNLASVPARTLLDASLAATHGNVTARLWAKNLLDEEYVSSSFFLIGTGGARSASYVPFLGDKRSVGVTISANF
jgi:iron complex outermembrane receptor protein